MSDAIQEAVKQTVENLRRPLTQNSSDSTQSAPNVSELKAKARDGYTCFVCKDMGWLYAADHVGDVVWNNGRPPITRCACQSGLDIERRRQHLLSIDGLNPLERMISFGELVRNEQNGSAIRQVEQSVDWRRGIVTLTGKPGTGKTTLLQCAVNAAREAGVPAVYTTVADLLDYLRSAYAPNAEVGFDARWDTLIRAEVLALDEMDEFSTTPWAMERFLRLIDERWRSIDHCLTLCAMNGRVGALPDKVASRLRDGRARIVEVKGEDQRPYQRWEAGQDDHSPAGNSAAYSEPE